MRADLFGDNPPPRLSAQVRTPVGEVPVEVVEAALDVVTRAQTVVDVVEELKMHELSEPASVHVSAVSLPWSVAVYVHVAL